MTRWARISTPLGVVVAAGDGALAGLWFGDDVPDDWKRDDDAFADVATQLGEWFAGARRDFDLELAPAGTPFQQRVWAALRTIPYGERRSYAAVASELGSAPRAVGSANGRNPISIIVPCHRLIGTDGLLRGYAGGLERKQWLLDHEVAGAPRQVAATTARIRRGHSGPGDTIEV